MSAAGAPKPVVGILIAALVLLPEGLAALRAARLNRLQTAMNLSLGSALASIGLTVFPDDDTDPDTLLSHADAAMYRAKSAGRNNWQSYRAE